MTFLLDVNVLIALTYPDHALHAQAHAWFNPARHWATCPATQAGFVRLAARLSGTENREGVRNGLSALELACASPKHEFWPMTVDLRHLRAVHRKKLLGHQQVADIQLLELAHRRGGQLATFDARIGELATGTDRASSVLVLRGAPGY